MLKRELSNKFVHRHNLLFFARVPAEQCKEIHHSLWQIAALAIAHRHCSCLRVVPLKREHREAELVAVALAELTLSGTIGFQEQR